MKELAKEDLKKFHEAAGRATNSGEPQAWRDWRTLIQSLGLSSSEATRLFYNRSVQRSYARFCFEEGLDEDGIDGYQRLLDKNARAERIYEHEAIRYLEAVRSAQGAPGVMEAYDRFPPGIGLDFPELQNLVASAEAEIGRQDLAVSRLRETVSRHPDVARNHSLMARLEFEAGNLAAARRCTIAAARRGSIEIAGIDLGLLRLQEDELERIAGGSRPPDLEQALVEFCENPGLTLLPSRKPSPHVFGGDEFEMPPCPRCYRLISLIASVDSISEPTLTRFAAKLPRLPIPHCRHCNLMFEHTDYRLVDDGRRIEVVSAHTPCEPKDMVDVDGPMHREFAKLAKPKRSRSSTLGEATELLANQRHAGPQFGGTAPWINEAHRCFCPRCDEEQVFYAAASETDAFQTHICLSPDGYIYYFACLKCLIISTRVDNT